MKSGHHYQRAVGKIAEHVQSELGGKMWALVTTRTECPPTAPARPATTRTATESWLVDEYKLKFSHHLKLIQTYDDDKARAFAIVFGQCTDTLKHKLKSYSGHAEMPANANAIKLLGRIKMLMLGDDHEQYHFWTMVLSAFRLHSCKQGSKESLEAFYTRWATQVQVHESKWGSYTPTKLFTNLSAEDDKNKFHVCLFLLSIDQSKYGAILTELNNSFLQGNKAACPRAPDEAINMISHWASNNNNSNKKKHADEYGTYQFTTYITDSDSSDDEQEDHEEKATSITEKTEPSTEPSNEPSDTWQF